MKIFKKDRKAPKTNILELLKGPPIRLHGPRGKYIGSVGIAISAMSPKDRP